jgi:dihydropteroate synthase
MKPTALTWGDHHLSFGAKPLIMGILNVTPDSFSDGGQFIKADDAIAQAEKMVQDGADIIDIGGESTRPFSEAVSVEEELQRVIPVIKELSRRISIPISIDTSKSGVARKALDSGASIINDISALRMDPNMADLAGAYGVPLILMHMQGTPKNMQTSPTYTDLFGEITSFLQTAVASAVAKGIEKHKIIIDPGIGFGKTVQHNLLILQNIHKFKSLGLPVLIGSSRKAFIRKLLKPANREDMDPLLPLVETGTQATVAAAAMNGADILRVHNVADTLATLKIITAIKMSQHV